MTAVIFADVQPGGSGVISIQNSGEAVENWAILLDNPYCNTEFIRGAGIFPEPYTTYHADNSRLRLMPLEVDQDEENPALFFVTARWTSDKLDPKKEQDDRDPVAPLDRKARISVETMRGREVRHKDFYGKPKMNSAGDLFDPPIESNVSYLAVKIRKNVTVFPQWVFDFDDAVNDAPFDIEIAGETRTIDKGCALIGAIRLGEQQDEGATPEFQECNLEMWVRKRRKPRDGEAPEDVPDPWQVEQLNEGLYYLFDGDATRKRRCQVQNEDGEVVDAVSPVLLDTNGTQIDNPTPDNAVYLVFRDHEEKDFGEIAFLWSDL